MINVSSAEHQILTVTNFQELVETPFQGAINAICWSRTLSGDFSEIVHKTSQNENITELDEAGLGELQLSEQGQLAREILLHDMQLLKAHGASPLFNIIRCYEQDDDSSFFPTDVYSYHVDRSPVPTDTFLCTYYGESSEILPNDQAQQKVLIPEIRAELKKLYRGDAAGFETFLSAHYFDLHYQPAPGAQPISLGNGNLWRLAVDHPACSVLPCVHRAPKEKNGQNRLLMIC
jgi:hypothetical protein